MSGHGGTRVQRQGGALLEAAGFVFVRESGHKSHIYEHPDGRRQRVYNSARGDALAIIKREIAKGERTAEVTTATPEQTVVAQYVSLADKDVFRDGTKGRAELKLKLDAFDRWLRRVMERNTRVLQSDLLKAAEQLGFTQGQLGQSRQRVGVVSYSIPGEGKGQGKGRNVVWVCLPWEMPAEAVRLGRKEKAPTEVAAVETEPEPEPEPEVAPEPKLPMPATLDDSYIEKAGLPPLQPLTNGVGVTVQNMDADVGAAALLLLESLGVKKPGQEAREKLAALDESLGAAVLALGAARNALHEAVRSLDV